MSRISIDSEGRIHLEDEPEPQIQEIAEPREIDAPVNAPDNPYPSNVTSYEEARASSTRFIKGFLIIVAVLAVVFCFVFFGSASGTGNGSSAENDKTTLSTTNNSSKSKPSAQTLTAEDQVVESYSGISDKGTYIDREFADQLMRDFELPFTFNQLKASSPYDLAELLSKLAEERSEISYDNDDHCTFTGRGKMQLYKDELTNPEIINRFDVPWEISVNANDKNGNLIFNCSLASIRSAARINDITFVGYVPVEDPTYGDVCEHVAQVFDYERIGLQHENDSDINGYAIANDVGPVYVSAHVKPGYFRIYLSCDPANNAVDYTNQIIKECPFQASR